jgi:hypothetical protein
MVSCPWASEPAFAAPHVCSQDTIRTYFSVLRDEFDAARQDIGFFPAVFGQGL